MFRTRFLLTAFGCALFALPAPAVTLEKEFTKTVALPLTGRLVLDTYKGSVTISTWDRAEARIKARIVADGECSSSSESVEKTRVGVSVFADVVRIKSDYAGIPSTWSFGWNDCSARPFVHYDISMPKTAGLEIKDYKSETKIKDLAADAVLSTYKGSIEVVRLDGGLRLETYKGDVRVDMSSVVRDIRLETYKGRIELAVPASARFRVDADSHKGEIEMAGFAVNRSESRHETRATATVNGGGPRIDFKTYKGTFRLFATKAG